MYDVIIIRIGLYIFISPFNFFKTCYSTCIHIRRYEIPIWIPIIKSMLRLKINFYIFTSKKRSHTQIRYADGNDNALQVKAICKCCGFYFDDTCRNTNSRQTSTFGKRTFSYAANTKINVYAIQCFAFIKCLGSNCIY